MPPMTSGSDQPVSPPFETAVDESGEPDDVDDRAEDVEPRGASGRTISRSTSAAQMLPARPSGTLNQKTHCQSIITSAPPRTGPITRPTAATIMLVPMASPS